MHIGESAGRADAAIDGGTEASDTRNADGKKSEQYVDKVNQHNPEIVLVSAYAAADRK